jgi:hypothetical protein
MILYTSIYKMITDKTKIIVVSSMLVITISTISDYFINKNHNWKRHLLFKFIVVPPMIWVLNKFIKFEIDMNRYSRGDFVIY